tara:strand:+ start:150 stop:1844 length:1695 start_codon:yes stop_codon:yes gene_type:complete
MINIFISSIFSCIILLSSGIIFEKFIFHKKTKNIDPWTAGLYGFIIIGFISLSINFFFPINKIFGTAYFFFSLIIFFIYFLKYKKKKELILITLFVSITSFLLITSANINRPDAGLYHLPYIRIIQENKIILGLTNLHYRFGYTSIFQYISAMYNNLFFKVEFLNLPLASLFPFFFLFLFKKFTGALRENNEIKTISIFFIIIFSLYSFNRYSNYGNDIPASIFFFVLIVIVFEIEKIKEINLNEFFYILIISIFLLMLKTSMVVVLLLPLVIFLLNKSKKNILKNKNTVLSVIFISSWIIKNILISGCVIFPLKETCLKNLYYYNENITILASSEAEAWAKGYPDSKKKMSFLEYNSNFNWIKTWANNHLIKILEKLMPLLIFIVIFFSKKIFNKSFWNKYNLKKLITNHKILLIIIFTSICTIFWFLKFPVYRFGMSFISTLIIFLSITFFINKKDSMYSKRFYFNVIAIGFILFCGKNLNRIIKNHDLIYHNSPWPQIYTMKINEKNNEKKFLKIKDDNLTFYYSGGEECMYSKSPCSNYYNKDLKQKKINYYSSFFIKKN